jgi:hypothetical protein
MYRRERIYKESLEKYNNRKTNIYLIPANSWWISNTEFREVKLMMNVRLSIGEEICQLKL